MHRLVVDNLNTHTPAVLDGELNVMGPVKAVLYGLFSARETDRVVCLCDVWPDGRSMNLCDGSRGRGTATRSNGQG